MEPLWHRLGFEQEDINAFVEEHCGLDQEVLQAVRGYSPSSCLATTDLVYAFEIQYQDELSRVKLLRQEKLASFIDAVRVEITTLWQNLHYGPKTCGYFDAFYDGMWCDSTSRMPIICLQRDSIEVESEDVLQLHEEEAQRLQSELSSKEQILPRVEEWVELRIQQQELEAKRNGPDRFNTRGGALLLEERTRKRIEKKMPLVSRSRSQLTAVSDNLLS